MKLFWKGRLTPATFLIFLYLLSSISAVILLYGYHTYDENRISPEAIIYHIITLFLCTYPILRFGNFKITQVIFPPFSKLNILAWILIILGITGTVVFSGQIIDLIKIGNYLENRNLFLQGGGDSGSKNIFEYIGRIGGCLSFVSVFLGFYYSSNGYKFKSFLLFVSSISTIIINALASGRQAVIFWLISVIFSYLVFKNELIERQRNTVRKILIVFSTLFLVYFVLVSTDRFKESEGGIAYQLINYTGQSNIYFSYGYELFYDNTFHGRKSFSYFFPPDERIPALNLNDYFSTDYSLNTFSTFIGSIYSDIGNINTLIFSFLFFLVTRMAFHSQRKISFFILCFYLFCFELVAQGMFYFLHAYSTPVKSYAVLLIIAFLISYTFIFKRRLIYHKLKYT